MPSLLLLGGVLAACRPAPGGAQDSTRHGVTLGLTYDAGSKPGLVVLPVAGSHGDSVVAIIQRDLTYSDRFNVIQLDSSDPAVFRADGAGTAVGSAAPSPGLNYQLFARLGAQGIVQITEIASGLHVALHDVSRAAVIDVGEQKISAAPLSRDWRLGVHEVSDQLEQWIRGERGIAATRIAYTRGSTIHVVDSDGADDIALPSVGNAMSPAWNPGGTMLVYSTWGVESRIVVFDLTTGRSRILNATPAGANLSPIFSPDGSAIAYAHAGDNGSDIYSVSLATGEVRRISAGRGSDNTSPTFSPDGRRIAFTSGRVGHPEIYTMDADGSDPELLTSFDLGDQNYRSDPDWSPDGRLIAFQSRIADRFQIMTIGVRGDSPPKQLTDEGQNEQPSWAPDGRHLVFASTRSGTQQLWIIDTESSVVRQLTHGGDRARLPAWSARLPND